MSILQDLPARATTVTGDLKLLSGKDISLVPGHLTKIIEDAGNPLLCPLPRLLAYGQMVAAHNGQSLPACYQNPNEA
jgi:hypothetical protein